jgi:potassium channel subfamily K
MASGSTNSEERPIRQASSAPSTPKPDPATIANPENGETNNVNGDANGDLAMNTADIWKAEKEGEGFYVRVHVWFASVVFPLFAGSFGPMSSAFAITALTENWRIDHNASDAEVGNPRW